MAELPASAPANEGQENLRTLPPPNRRRDKPQLSCNLCRRRKLKCDRDQPCGTCSSRGLSLSCTYAQNRANHRQPLQISSPRVQDKISQLEGLVLSLRSRINAIKPAENTRENPSEFPLLKSSNSIAENQAQLSDSFGRITLDNAETSYVGSDHWIAILDGIAELKDNFEENVNQPEDLDMGPLALEMDGPELFFGKTKYATKDEILAAIPARAVVDRLMSKYLSTLDTAPVAIHRSTFLKEYERFWEEPGATSVMWLGLLYTIMCLATQFSHLSENNLGGTPEISQSSRVTQKLIQGYREKIVQCLVLSKYTKCEPYTVETLFLYFAVEHYLKQDTHSGNWVLFGTVVRIAMRMGFHRDPSHSSQISPFHGEMRRRAWALIFQIDILMSSQIGLPRMINPSQCDTKEPHNLIDEDFDESTMELPSPRPNSDCTPMLYIIVRNRLVTVFGMISDMRTSTKPYTYAEVMKLDTLLLRANAAIPPVLKPRAMANSITDHAGIIVQRIYLAMLVHKAQCLLHYRYLIAGRSDSRYVYSRETCIESALELLHYQSMLHEETKAGGQLCEVKWKVSSFVHADFFHAATVLCIYLDHEIAANTVPQSTREVTNERIEKVEKTLHESYRIWLQASTLSRDARKAAAAVRIVLGKVQKARTVPSTDTRHKSQSFSGSKAESSSFSEDPVFGAYYSLPPQPDYLAPSQDPFPAALGSNTTAPGFQYQGDNSMTVFSNLLDWENSVSQFQGAYFPDLVGGGGNEEGFEGFPI